MQFLVLTAAAAEPAERSCSLCVGIDVYGGNLPTGPAQDVPALITKLSDVGPQWAEWNAHRLAGLTVVPSITIQQGPGALTQVEQQTKELVDWAVLHGPFDGFGVNVNGVDAETRAFAVKRVAVAAQGRAAARRIVVGPISLADLIKLYEANAQAYFDAVIVEGPQVAETAKWLEDHDPAKKICAIVTSSSPNPMFDVATAFAEGATTVFLKTPPPPPDSQELWLDHLYSLLANTNNVLKGDWAFDSVATISSLDAKGKAISDAPVLSFVRGEDLKTMLVPRGSATASTIISLPSSRYAKPKRVDSEGERDITDVGQKDNRFLIGVPAVKEGFVITVEHADKPDANVTKEAINVATERGITVEEIIRNHQAYKSFQESIQPKYIARNATKLRFSIGDGGDAFEATMAGDYFSSSVGTADWVWHDFYVNGVKWKYGKVPEFPLIQAEKVTQLPLDIHLTNDYRYQLVRKTDVDGYHTYEVRFEPPANAPADLPLYRGTVWIDSHTFARVRISMIQLHLTGEVLSNEERVDFQPFARVTNKPMTVTEVAKADPRTILWLPSDIDAQQVISAGGRANVVLRATEFSEFRIDPPEFDTQLKQAAASDARMVRDTEGELKYLVKNKAGERVVKPGYDTARTFALAGVHHDAGLQYPVVPLGGIDYFNFDFKNTGLQTNVFFAGVVAVANATNPNVANTHTNIGADLFAIAIPTTASTYRNGDQVKSEDVKTLPTSLSLRAGHSIFGFGKIDFSLGLEHVSYSRADDTAPSFTVPTSTFVISPSIDGEYSRWGYTLSGFYTYSKRTDWQPWGNPAEYNPNQKTYTNFGVAVGKSYYLPKFQRIGVQVNYVDGQRLDRFSGYELGFFGSQRVHGVKSGSVPVDRAFLAHLSYGFVISDQFRLEALYDHALVTEDVAGYHNEPFQGLGIAGQTVGPWGTIIRLDIGKTIGRNKQGGFVADVVALKLF